MTLIVGIPQRTFVVHANLLCSNSPFLERRRSAAQKDLDKIYLIGGYYDDPKMFLPDVRSAEIRIYLDWLYARREPILLTLVMESYGDDVNNAGASGMRAVDVVNSLSLRWQLGDKFEDRSLTS